jgi:hypothetical protein
MISRPVNQESQEELLKAQLTLVYLESNYFD